MGRRIPQAGIYQTNHTVTNGVPFNKNEPRIHYKRGKSVCVCVCVRERERERDRALPVFYQIVLLLHTKLRIISLLSYLIDKI